MADFAVAGKGDHGHWRQVCEVAASAVRAYALVVFPDRSRVAPPWFNFSSAGSRFAYFAEGCWLLVEDLPSPKPCKIVLRAACVPTAFVLRADAPPPPGFSGAGVLPRCLFRPSVSPPVPSFDLAAAEQALEAGDLDGALVFAGKLCLTKQTTMLAQFLRPLSQYVVSHPLHRGDRMGLFAAAVSGLRG